MRNKSRKRDLRIFKNMEDSVKEIGLKILQTNSLGNAMLVESFFEYANYSIGIVVAYEPQHELISIAIRYAEAPLDKIERLIRLMNRVNMMINTSHYAINPESGLMMLVAGLPVTGHLDKAVLKKLLKDVLGYNLQFVKVIFKVITTDEDPDETFKDLVVMPDMPLMGGDEDEE